MSGKQLRISTDIRLPKQRMKKFKSWASVSAYRATCLCAILASLLSSTALSGCTISEVTPEPSTAEVPVQLPTFRLSSKPSIAIDSLTNEQVDDTIAVSGEIAQRAAMLDGWLYQIKDETGSLWVLTDRDAPELGEFVTVEGAVRYEAIMVENIDAGEFYIEEKARQQTR